MRPSRPISFLLLLALGLAVLPAPLEAACEIVAHPEGDPCGTCLTDACDDGACAGGEGHAADDCCATGCQHCSLPCCAGTAMISAAAQTVGGRTPNLGLPTPEAARPPRVDDDPLYHPPRR
jgi:hypothetical protein